MASKKESPPSIIPLIATGLTTIAVALVDRMPAILDSVKIPKPEEKLEVNEDEVAIPYICKKGFPVSLEQASQMLMDVGLKVVPIEVRVADAHPRYKDCTSGQVVDSAPKSGKKVKVGSSVVVKYVTQDVIDESQLIFSKRLRLKKSTKGKQHVELEENSEKKPGERRSSKEDRTHA